MYIDYSIITFLVSLASPITIETKYIPSSANYARLLADGYLVEQDGYTYVSSSGKLVLNYIIDRITVA